MAFDHPRTEVRLTLRWSKGDSNRWSLPASELLFSARIETRSMRRGRSRKRRMLRGDRGFESPLLQR